MSETWSNATGIYLTDNDYTYSNRVITISEYKEILNIDDIPPILIGENNSEAITFEMNRYKGAIDLSSLQIQVLFQAEEILSTKSVYNVKVNADKIRFIWVIDQDITQLSVVPFNILVTGKVKDKAVVWKSLPSILKLKEALNQNNIKPIKSSAWYTNFTLQMQSYMDESKRLKEEVSGFHADLDKRIANITDNESSMAEVVDSRGGYTILKNRLDAMDAMSNRLDGAKANKSELTAQINEVHSEINSLDSNKANVSDVNTQISNVQSDVSNLTRTKADAEIFNNYKAMTDGKISSLESTKVDYPILNGEIGVVNVKYPYHDCRRFGVVGDGVVDDTSRLKIALSNLGTVTKKMYLPKGKYLITSPISIELLRDIEIYGDDKGDDGTIINYVNTTTDYCFKFYGLNNFTLKNLRINCNKNKGLLFGDKDANSLKYRSGHTLVEDLTIFNSLQGLSFDCAGGFNEFLRFGVDVCDNGIAVSIGENFTNTLIMPNYIFFNRCNLQNSSKTNTIGFKLNCAQYMQINQCDIAGFDYGIKIENTKEVSNLVICNNYFFNIITSSYIYTGEACRNITLRDNNHLLVNGTYLNVQNGSRTVYSMLVDGDFIQGTVLTGYILNNVYLKLTNLKTHFLYLNRNPTIGSSVTVEHNMLPLTKVFSLVASESRTLTFEMPLVPTTINKAIVFHDNDATITQSISTNVLTVTIKNTYTSNQEFTVFIP